MYTPKIYLDAHFEGNYDKIKHKEQRDAHKIIGINIQIICFDVMWHDNVSNWYLYRRTHT